MQIEVRPLSAIRPYDHNPRVNDDAVDAVARSLQEFGWRQPIVVDSDGVIVVGHTRYKAAQRLGWTEAPVHVAVDLDPIKARAYRIADNQTATIAEWDTDLLPVELKELEADEFDLSLLGFTPEQLAEFMAPEPTEGNTDADGVPDPPADVVTKRGDLWLLGEHRLLCGGSTDAADVDALMDGKQAAICASDPPYVIDYTGERPKGSGKDWSGTYREIDITDPAGFFRSVFAQVLRVLAPHAAIYCWHSHKRQALLSSIWEDLGILSHQQVVWVKPTAVFGRSVWHFRHEPCLMGWRQGSAPQPDGDHSFDSVWEIDWEGKARIIGNEHPTQKPVEIFARPMRRHTGAGAVCFEPFSGSGSQIIAAQQLGRRCYAMELEPVFVEVAVRRWEKFTGKTAQRIPAEQVRAGASASAGEGEADSTSENAPATAGAKKGKGKG